ncbi:hypothetical protein KR054_006998 [Drosophila jambulina]|nr:hypothetical protein KR054_006998 [Drosophila jambulina]
MEKLPYEDLKAFEHRLREVVTGHRRSRFRHHKLIAVVVFAISLVLYYVPMSLWQQTGITLATIILIIPFILDYRKPELSQEEIATQTRSVLEAFDMSCDDSGKLILKASRSRTPSTAGESN